MSRFVKKYTAIFVAWIVVIVASILLLPNMSNLVSEKGQTKIPATAQSQIANNMQKHWGHNIGNTDEAVIVFNKSDQKLSRQDTDNINKTVQKLKDNQSDYGIKGITAPNDNSATKKQLVSKDKTTQLVQLNVTKDRSIKSINSQLTDAAKTNGVKTYVTGGSILNDDFQNATEQGIQKTEVIAAVFILIVLIIVFRSPIVPLVSLFTVGVSLITSLSIVMNLVNYLNFPLSSFTRVFMVIVLFGIGTDYNILLYNQFKEELSSGKDSVAATINARKIAGKTILYSGGSVLIGFATLGLAKFSIYQSAVGVAIGVAVLLLVLTTLNPFFMALLGKKLFWPSKNFKGENDSKLWAGMSKHSVLHPIIAILICLVVTVPFMATYHNNLNYDNSVELHNNVPSKQGLLTVQDHFSKGTAMPSSIYIKSNHNLNNEKDLETIDRVTKQLQSEKGVKTVSSVTQPGGTQINDLYVQDQLGTLNGKMGDSKSGLNQITKGLSSNSFNDQQLKAVGTSAQDIAKRLQAIQASSKSSGGMSNSQMMQQIQKQLTASGQPLSQAQMQVVGNAFQQVATKQQGLMSNLEGQLQAIAKDTQSIGNNTQATGKQLQGVQKRLASANDGLKQINQGFDSANDYLTSLQKSSAANSFYIPDNVLKSDTFKDATNSYLSQDKKYAKMTVVLSTDPNSKESLNKAGQLETQIKNNLKGTSLDGSKVAIGGQTSATADTSNIATHDFLRTAIIMSVGIIIALIFVTRSILQPLYIMGTLLIAYVTSLHLTKLFSGWILGQSTLTWNTPFFTFVMLVALGVDYSIFLMMKYREYGKEVPTPSTRIRHASAVIGTVVISAAIILGGTFASLMPSGVLTLIQVALGVIIGLILLVFLIPTLMSSLIKLTYESHDKNDSKQK